MKSIKILVKKFKNEKGEFTSASIKGKFLPFAIAEEDTYYRVRLTKNGAVTSLPEGEGIYDVAYTDMWLDNRKGMAEKHILRIVASRIVFVEPLKEKDLPF